MLRCRNSWDRRPSVLLIVLTAISPLASSCARTGTPVSTLSAQTAAPERVTVSLRQVRRHVRATGTIQPVEAVTIRVPELQEQGDMILIKVAPSGARVAPGDVVAEFDRTRILERARDAKAKFEDLEHQVEQRKAQQNSDREQRASELQQAQADLDKARLDLRKGPLLSDIDRMKAEERLDIARRHVASLRKIAEIRSRGEAADLRILELQRDRQKLALERAETNAAMLQIRASIAGMVAQEAVWRRGGDSQGPPQEGDQLWPGQAIMRIFSSTDMEVQLSLAEPDRAGVDEQTKALVRLDAYPALVFKAHFEAASPVASSLLDSPVRVFPARFLLDDHDPHLLPDLTAAVDLETGPPAPVPAIPRAAIRYRNGQPYVLQEAASGRRETPVVFGAFDDAWVEIRSGLKPGDAVLLPSPAAAGGGSR